MVKGITKRVIVVKAPISSIFDEAIFILNENSASSVDAENILREACLLADGYVKKNCIERTYSQKRRFLLAGMLPALIITVSVLIYFVLK